ncbi:hybrid sensor histidine kinase/response regulator [Rhodoferax fermentans]|nr:hybrid sensor histidine kinase/response regulator [Rhodoferax fermentans]
MSMKSVTGWGERARQVRAGSVIGLVFGLVFAAFNLLTPGQWVLGCVELAAVLLLVAPATVFASQAHRVGLAENLLLASALVIFSALIVLGGVEGTGLYWVYTVPFLAFFLKGQLIGWLLSAGFLGLATLYFLAGGPSLPWAYHYTPVAGPQFLMSLLFYTLMAAAFDHVRSRYAAELARRKDQAEAASLGKSRFLAAASHDLRQPAHALGMFVARLTQLPQQDAATRELVAGVDASVRALQEMLDAFFDYSRLDAPSMEVRLAAFPVNQLLDQLRISFDAMAAAKGLRLHIRPSPIWVHSDPVLLHRVLLNLLSNAVQHTHRGCVLVSCRPGSGHGQARIEVWDSGIGIASEYHEKIFQEFFQISNPERDRHKGLGLGLSLVQRACLLLNHPVTLRSQPGCGTRFCVQVPMVPAPAVVAPVAVPMDPPGSELAGLRVLLIEDDALGGVALAGLLRSWGCQVTSAVDVPTACALVSRSQPPAFVLSDYRLPGVYNGIDAICLLRQTLGADLPACVISGDTETSVRQQVQSAGLVLLQKPVRPAKLRNLLRHAVQGSAMVG